MHLIRFKKEMQTTSHPHLHCQNQRLKKSAFIKKCVGYILALIVTQPKSDEPSR